MTKSRKVELMRFVISGNSELMPASGTAILEVNASINVELEYMVPFADSIGTILTGTLERPEVTLALGAATRMLVPAVTSGNDAIAAGSESSTEVTGVGLSGDVEASDVKTAPDVIVVGSTLESILGMLLELEIKLAVLLD